MSEFSLFGTNFSRYDKQYIDTLSVILNNGVEKKDRTSVGGNISVFGQSDHFFCGDLSGKEEWFEMPFLQCRSFAPRIAFLEMQWMLSGNTDANWLKERNVHIWDGNTTREFLDSKGLTDLEEGSIGKGYGYQFRNFNGVDQLQKVIDGIKKDPVGRKHIISLWNPDELDEMALEPCHLMYTFYSNGEVLSLHQSMRSNDYMFGRPYNSAFAAMMLVVVAKITGQRVGAIWTTVTDCHIYNNQIDIARELVEKAKGTFCAYTPKERWYLDESPRMRISKDINSLEDFFDLDWTDIDVYNFKKGPNITSGIEMAV